MARDVKEAREAGTMANDLLKSQELLADGYNKEADSKAGAIKLLEEKLKKAEEALKEKDELIVELSTRVATTEEVITRASLNFSSSADLITQLTGLAVGDLLAVVQLEKLVGLELMKGERPEPPRFKASMAQRLGRISKAVNFVLYEWVEAEARQGLMFVEGFGRCLY